MEQLFLTLEEINEIKKDAEAAKFTGALPEGVVGYYKGKEVRVKDLNETGNALFGIEK